MTVTAGPQTVTVDRRIGFSAAAAAATQADRAIMTQARIMMDSEAVRLGLTRALPGWAAGVASWPAGDPHRAAAAAAMVTLHLET